jgi:regulator of replication initiation timing
MVSTLKERAVRQDERSMEDIGYLSKILASRDEQKKKLRDEIETLKAENETLKAENETLKAERETDDDDDDIPMYCKDKDGKYDADQHQYLLDLSCGLSGE